MPLLTKSAFARLAEVSAMSITKAINAGNRVLAPALVGKKIDPDHEAAIAYLDKIAAKKAGVKSKPAVKKPKAKAKKSVKVSQKAEKKPEPKQENHAEPENIKVRGPRVKHSRLESSIKDLLESVGNEHEEQKQLEMLRGFVSQQYVKYLPDDIREMGNYSLNDIISVFGTKENFKIWVEATKKMEDITALRIKNENALGELVSRELVLKAFIAPLDGLFTRILTDGSKVVVKELKNFFELDRSLEECEERYKKILSGFIVPTKEKIIRSAKTMES